MTGSPARASPPSTVTLGLRISTQILGGGEHKHLFHCIKLLIKLVSILFIFSFEKARRQFYLARRKYTLEEKCMLTSRAFSP